MLTSYISLFKKLFLNVSKLASTSLSVCLDVCLSPLSDRLYFSLHFFLAFSLIYDRPVFSPQARRTQKDKIQPYCVSVCFVCGCSRELRLTKGDRLGRVFSLTKDRCRDAHQPVISQLTIRFNAVMLIRLRQSRSHAASRFTSLNFCPHWLDSVRDSWNDSKRCLATWLLLPFPHHVL